MTIRFRDITFTYQGQKPLYENIFLDLPENKTILLQGENGVGKTTLASLAAGLLHPKYGRIRYESNGLPLLKSHEIHSNLSLLQQITEHNLMGVNPLEDLLLWLLSSSEHVYENDVRISRILNEWQLTEKKTTPLWELSSGELKSLALAGISLHKNRYWILDEPLTSLDEKHTRLLLEILQVKRKVSPGMLIISHNAELFANIIDEVITITPQGLVETDR